MFSSSRQMSTSSSSAIEAFVPVTFYFHTAAHHMEHPCHSTAKTDRNSFAHVLHRRHEPSVPRASAQRVPRNGGTFQAAHRTPFASVRSPRRIFYNDTQIMACLTSRTSILKPSSKYPSTVFGIRHRPP